MPAAIDVLEPHRQAVVYFGAVVYKDGAAVPTVNTGLLTSAFKFQQQTGIEIAHGSHVISIESSLIGEVKLDDRLLVDGDAYINHGPVAVAEDRAVTHLQVVPERV